MYVKTTLLQSLANKVYAYLDIHHGLTRLEACNYFSTQHRAAVMLCDLNCQVRNGGFLQWHDNGYSEDLNDLLIFASRGKAQGIPEFDKLHELLVEFKNIDLSGSITVEIEQIRCNCNNGPDCNVCGGKGWFDEEIESVESNYDKIKELNLDSRYYALESIQASIETFLERFDEKVEIVSETPVVKKPKVKLIGQDGNVFNLLEICQSALMRDGMAIEAKSIVHEVTAAGSYDEALCVLMKYCDIN